MRLNRFSWLFVLTTMGFLPNWAYANSLNITDVDTPAADTPAAEAKVSVYFDFRQGDGTAVTGISPENCTLIIDGKPADVLNASIREFSEGDRGVGILFIFPIAKNYSEESFGIRSTLGTLIQRLNRPIDQVSAVPYDISPKTIAWSRAFDSQLSKTIQELATTDVLEPNLFQSFNPAISMMESLQNVSQKYIVLISDAEGAIVGEPERAGGLIGKFAEQLKKNNIKPIVIGYSPDGPDAMGNVSLIKRIANNAGGVYYQAEDLLSFQQIVTTDVYNYIYKQYIYDATLNMDGSNYLDGGKYNFQLIVKTNNSEEKSATKVTWPDLKKDRTTMFVVIGSIAGLLLLGGVAFVMFRRRREEEEVFVQEETGEVSCAVCGRVIPQQLYGFKGEFCLSGGLPDCPYYQPPDRGKIQITRGAMADTTFFIKKDMTTIGSYPENDIYLADRSVSRKHAAIKADDGMRYEIRDFGSSNGVYINNDKIERKFLKDGDVIRFGAIETVFKLK